MVREARRVVLRLNPPSAGGAAWLLQRLNAAVGRLGEGGRAVLARLSPSVVQIGGRDAVLTLTPQPGADPSAVEAVAQIAATFCGPFRVRADLEPAEGGA